MPDELDLNDTINDDEIDADLGEDLDLEDKEIGDVDSLVDPIDDVEDLEDDDSVIDPEKDEDEEGEDLYGFGLPGKLNDDGEFESGADDEDEDEDEPVDEDLF